MLKALSWGVGLQSTTLLEMSACGDLPKIDAAIFADTGFEHAYSYEIFDFYAPRARKAGIEVIKLSGQDIFVDNFKHVTLPLFVVGGDKRGRQIKRKCTRDYKIRPIQRQIRELLGVNPRGRLKPNLVELWLGISTDEIQRAKDSRVAYIVHEFPLLDKLFDRDMCAEYLANKGLPVPGKSSCVFCPYKKIGEWSELEKNDPNTLDGIITLENHINDNGLIRIGGQRKNVAFLPSGSLAHADYSNAIETDAMCDGGFCHA